MSAQNANRRQDSSREEWLADRSPTDADIVQTTSSADIEQIYREEAPGLARYFRSRLRPEEDPRDFVQESFVRLADFMSNKVILRPAASLQRIARNLLYNRSKRAEVRLAAFHLPICEGREPTIDPDQEQLIEAKDVIRTYLKALDELPARTRDVFVLHRIEELTYREIGLKLGISIPAVQRHMARALAHIDAALERG
jgi:RNA polymerase sigma factor (sigma-70 family)